MTDDEKRRGKLLFDLLRAIGEKILFLVAIAGIVLLYLLVLSGAS